MKPLRVALIIKPNCSQPGEGRKMGYFSYAVPEFTWQSFSPGSGNVDLRPFKDFDLIYHEDGGNWGEYIRDAHTPPVVYMSIDSTLSDTHYQERLKQGSMADMILVDHDKLERFKVGKKPVRRLNYCVNDHLFKPLEKTIDVNFHCASGARKGYPGGNERNELRAQLDGICKELGLSYASGVLGLPEYAEAMGHSRVVVNLPRTPINRPHRVFDAMACEAQLLTGQIPRIPEDKLTSRELTVFDDIDQLTLSICQTIYQILKDDIVPEKAINGYDLVTNNHTWSIRAQQLRQILSEELGI